MPRHSRLDNLTPVVFVTAGGKHSQLESDPLATPSLQLLSCAYRSLLQNRSVHDENLACHLTAECRFTWMQHASNAPAMRYRAADKSNFLNSAARSFGVMW